MEQSTVFMTLAVFESFAPTQQRDLASQFPSIGFHLVYTDKQKQTAESLSQSYPYLQTGFCVADGPIQSALASQSTAFVLEEGFSLSFACTLPAQTEPYLHLYFHTFAEAMDFVLANVHIQTDLPDRIQAYGALLASGKLVAFPTETVYGLGADATNEQAVKHIFEAKQRPFFDPLIVHIADLSQLEGLVVNIDDQARTLMQTFWPGPLTLVLQKDPRVPDIVTAGSQTVAVRMPDNALALSLIRASGKPIAAPSANRFGYTSPTTAEHVREQLTGRIEAILDGGACQVGIESTVLSLCTKEPTILRPGKIGMEELKPLLPTVTYSSKVGPTDTVLSSPGLLESHYAPTTAFYLVEDVNVYKDREDVGILLFEKTHTHFKGPVAYISESEDAKQAASRLYWAIRHLDQQHLSFMVGSLLPETGIGVAINNRLRKASTKHGSPVQY
ncbi:MAG: L-threonylcarbamoyladenylate synthase [Sphaerochaeta sp.]|jgi:L-threonylcarbamoyladenylate synthase|uniref:L-threonylcarbamoyladenylate synthase n=1 Tax=Sphaerochaeta sp. TaxID=1972642 RepID=UPI002FC70A48